MVGGETRMRIVGKSGNGGWARGYQKVAAKARNLLSHLQSIGCYSKPSAMINGEIWMKRPTPRWLSTLAFWGNTLE